MQLHTINEVAQQLGLSPATVRHWAYGHRSPPADFPAPIKIGRRLRFIAAEIESWIRGLQGRQVEPAVVRLARGRPRRRFKEGAGAA